ncbi:unnamed protein product [Caenorhabditis sp. 36 PRJEB53466]|nr:unnamed protein product [Caenorhabditis sp. 36 PRJEB53466]
MPRVLATESEVFTLDDVDVDEIDELKPEHRITVPKEEEEEKSRLVECNLDSDEEDDKTPPPEEEDDKGQNIRQSSNNSSTVESKERCRLRDSFDLDNDSLSDDLDLLPPIPGAPNVNSSWCSKLHRFNCCNPRIPAKCTIM